MDNMNSWEQNIIKFNEPYLIILFFQFLIDLGGIEHCIDRRKPFNYSNSPFKFTLSFTNETMIKAYLIQITDNFEKFKFVRNFLKKPKNIFEFYEILMNTLEFHEIKSGLKIYPFGFQTTDLIIWIKMERYTDLNTTYGAELLGECMRQLKVFSILKNGNCFENNLSTTYTLTSEDEFKIIFSRIEKTKDWKDCLTINLTTNKNSSRSKSKSIFRFKSFEEDIE